MRSERPDEMNGATLNGEPVDWDSIENAQLAWARSQAWRVCKAACDCDPWAHWTPYVLDGQPAFQVHLHHDQGCAFQRILQRMWN